MILRVLDPPQQEPLTLAEAKVFLRVDHDADDVEIEAMIRAAREQAELYQGREVARKRLEMLLDGWPRRGPILTPAPLVQVEDIRYRLADGTWMTWPATEYLVAADAEPGEIHPRAGWPGDALWPAGAVSVRMVCGWLPDDVPEHIRQGMKLLITSWYEHRTGYRLGNILTEVPVGITALLSANRLVRF
jgi:uncharacterized phiE125 gp8 family phage protein